jgi:hypothetical protein
MTARGRCRLKGRLKRIVLIANNCRMAFKYLANMPLQHAEHLRLSALGGKIRPKLETYTGFATETLVRWTQAGVRDIGWLWGNGAAFSC